MAKIISLMKHIWFHGRWNGPFMFTFLRVDNVKQKG